MVSTSSFIPAPATRWPITQSTRCGSAHRCRSISTSSAAPWNRRGPNTPCSGRPSPLFPPQPLTSAISHVRESIRDTFGLRRGAAFPAPAQPVTLCPDPLLIGHDTNALIAGVGNQDRPQPLHEDTIGLAQ